MKQAATKLLAIVIVMVAFSLPAHAEWRIYENPRFGFTFSYPAQIFAPGSPPANGDGLRFYAKDSKAIISAWGSYNTLEHNPDTYFAFARDEVGVVDAITYKRLAKDWLVISGYKGNMVYYEKTIFTCNFQRLTSISITYPASRKKDYDGLVGKITKSLNPGTPDGCQ